MKLVNELKSFLDSTILKDTNQICINVNTYNQLSLYKEDNSYCVEINKEEYLNLENFYLEKFISNAIKNKIYILWDKENNILSFDTVKDLQENEIFKNEYIKFSDSINFQRC